MLLTTDGLVEEMKDDLAYGEERLANILFNNHHLSSQEIVEIIEADFKNFQGKIPKDDITFLVIKYEPN